jgi:hypothetical protein
METMDTDITLKWLSDSELECVESGLKWTLEKDTYDLRATDITIIKNFPLTDYERQKSDVVIVASIYQIRSLGMPVRPYFSAGGGNDYWAKGATFDAWGRQPGELILQNVDYDMDTSATVSAMDFTINLSIDCLNACVDEIHNGCNEISCRVEWNVFRQESKALSQLFHEESGSVLSVSTTNKIGRRFKFEYDDNNNITSRVDCSPDHVAIELTKEMLKNTRKLRMLHGLAFCVLVLLVFFSD